MPIYKLIKNGQVDNIIIADEVESIKDQYDSIEEAINEVSAIVVEPKIDVAVVRSNLTLSEKVKWDNDSTPNIVTAKIEFSISRSIADATEILEFLVDGGDISQQSMDKIIDSVGG